MMNKENYIWENDRFRKDPYQVPEGYFAEFPDRMMDRIDLEMKKSSGAAKHLLRPWMAWVSGVAAFLVFGWFGIRTFYIQPLQETRYQEDISMLVEFYSQELHEGQLASYFADNKIDLELQSQEDASFIIQIDPDLAEEYIYESVGF